MRVIISLILIAIATNLSAGETVYYCSMQNFVDAKPNKHSNYQRVRFKMKINRENQSSNSGRVSFSDDHPFSISFKAFGYNVGYLQSGDGVSSFGFHLDSGQMFQAWATPNEAVAFSAKCDEF